MTRTLMALVSTTELSLRRPNSEHVEDRTALRIRVYHSPLDELDDGPLVQAD